MKADFLTVGAGFAGMDSVSLVQSGLDLLLVFGERKAERFLHDVRGEDDVIGGFIHYRFCYDDDETPNCIVLYIYEIQIRDIYQKKYGFGKTLMSYIDMICEKCNINKIMLTVFKNNKIAMNFYINTLHFIIDETSPSKHGDCNTDYEILSKTTTR